MSSWFCAYSGSKETSPDGQMKGGRQPLAPPFGTDNSTSWERETDRFTQGKEKVNGLQKCITPSHFHCRSTHAIPVPSIFNLFISFSHRLSLCFHLVSLHWCIFSLFEVYLGLICCRCFGVIIYWNFVVLFFLIKSLGKYKRCFEYVTLYNIWRSNVPELWQR